jgi:carbamoyl-phosphate synthase large subunit
MPIVGQFHEMGFTLYATEGTARYLRGRGIPARQVRKVHEGRPNGIDLMVNGEVQLLINTPLGKHAQHDDYLLRRTAIAQRVSYTTTMSAARAASDAILALRSRRASVRSLQEWHQDGAAARVEAGSTEPGAPADVPPAGDSRNGGSLRANPRMAPREAST